jgi:hypothetical protein
MVTLVQRISRNNIEDQIYLGQLVEKATKGEFGDLLRCLCNGVQKETLTMSQSEHSKLSADRYLGRLEGIDILTEKLVLMVDNLTSLQEEKRSSERVKSAETD